MSGAQEFYAQEITELENIERVLTKEVEQLQTQLNEAGTALVGTQWALRRARAKLAAANKLPPAPDTPADGELLGED